MNTATTKKAPAARKPKAAAKPATVKAGTGKGKTTGQSQDAGTAFVKDVADTTSTSPKPAPAAVERGGTLNVPIEVMAVPPKPYSARAMAPEDYPFSKLTPAVKAKTGDITGPSFFIPDLKLAEQKLATARKRHRKAGLLFWSRKTNEQVGGKGPKVPGLRIWRGTPDIKPK